MAGRRITWADIGLTVILVIVGLYGTGPAALNQGQTAPPGAYALAVAASLPIVLWRWRPLWTFALTGAAATLYIGLGYAYGPIMVTLALAVYGMAARSPIRQALSAIGALLAASLLAVGVSIVAGDRHLTEFINVTAWLVIPAAAGMVIKVRRDAAADVRAEQARRAVSEERLHLAQEVHDVAGHGLAVIAMQAGVALRMLDRDPTQARASLEAIRATSKEALEGLRAELEVLRTGSGWAAAPRRPSTGLADLPGLVDRMRSSGLPVTLDLTGGEVDGMPADVAHAAYRIVQESLTNVLRHAGPEATARVRVDRSADALQVEVLDTGRGRARLPGRARMPGRNGHGIEGMRERAEALGGTFEAGARPSGGFAVRARLPYSQTALGGDST